MSLLLGLIGGGGLLSIAGAALHFTGIFADSDARSNTWKIGAIVAGLGAAALAVWLVVLHFDNKHLTKANARLDSLINDPKTGYVVKLVQAHANVDTLQHSVEMQTKALKDRSDADARQLAETQAKLAAAQEQTRKADARVHDILSRPLQGKTTGDQCIDADRQLMETLK